MTIILLSLCLLFQVAALILLVNVLRQRPAQKLPRLATSGKVLETGVRHMTEKRERRVEDKIERGGG